MDGDSIKDLLPEQVGFVEQLTAIQGSIRSFCNSIMAAGMGVDDVVQESNRVILEKASEFTPGTNFQAWAFTIVRFQAMAYYKKNKREHKLLFNTDLVQTLMSKSLQESKNSERMVALEQCVGELRSTDQALLKHRYWGEKTLAQYATEANKSVDAIKRRLFRIRIRLRNCMIGKLATEEGQ